ncbi:MULTISPECIES: TIM-barrel domain-containing protein [unclassified Streptomyces]|uniref:TIM-barrel domain-containing protein n=1 Tax=unclassified Streptomyces TaxID=2593676 RepID=UPI002E1673E2|nr:MULTISPECIES: TIM-barrel domain-containing protein [unclassified Streptomyces]WSR22730.1 discoidin domain-containing protein [Streptomyces sp. NBC_01205]
MRLIRVPSRIRKKPKRQRACLAALLAGALAVAGLAAAGPMAPPAAAAPAPATAGNATGLTRSGNTFTVSTTGGAKARVVVARTDIFRLWLSPDGSFTNDPAGSDLAPTTDFGSVDTAFTDAGAYYRITTGALNIRVNKAPLKFSVYRADNSTLVWQETQPTSWTGTRTTQYLARGADEQFYGTGLRLGEWALRGKTVPVAVDNKWRENNNASPAPFYMSTNGYGVMRNTWAPGSYGFNAPTTLTHDEKRFDAWYFTGDSLKSVLDAYTDVSGKPFMAPMWGMELGNADCFNASNPAYQGDHDRLRHQTTPDVVGYATDARAADMPSGWFLPNDGYGCGYTAPLKSTVEALQAKGFQTGLWTSTGLGSIADEVGVAGTRGVKTDVAWIGGGYKTAFTGVQQAVDGIEKNSDARRYVWTVDGWAGTQRNAVVWTGDTNGTWDDMRWHVPAIAGAGLSALNYASGDVDGIFGGSPKTYTRDLQWKAFTPAFMTMSGWGATNPSAGYQDKQPWRFAEPYLSINRKYLQLKMRLMPYLYTMSRTAHESGVPSTRALVLEYPDDPVARGNLTSGQFMAGDSFLVAPVVSDTSVRDGIYLPAGTWTDYWSGKTYAGPGWLNNYQAPLDTLPLFVKGGAIVPMWPQMNYSGEKPVSTLTYDVHPRGNSSFSLYEDDGLTRAYQSGAYARQQVDVTAPTAGSGTVTVSVGAPTGSYSGKPAARGYEFTLHVASAPGAVTADGAALARQTSKAAYDAAASGWYFDPADRGGVLWVKSGTKSGAFAITVTGTSVPAADPIPVTSAPVPQSAWSLVSTDSQETAAENGAAANAFDGNPGTIWHTAWSSGTPAALPHEISIDLGARYAVDALGYLPRQDGGVNGRIGNYEVYVSDTTTDWGTPVATGAFDDTAAAKSVSLSTKTGRYLRLRSLTEAGGRGPWTSAAEISLTGRAAPLPADATLVGAASARCADLPHSATAPGTEPTLYTCHGGPNQRWTLGADGRVTGLGGVCLDGTSASRITVQTCGAAAGQIWRPGPDGSLRTLGQCLAPVGAGTVNGTGLTRAACDGSAAQRWTFTP